MLEWVVLVRVRNGRRGVSTSLIATLGVMALVGCSSDEPVASSVSMPNPTAAPLTVTESSTVVEAEDAEVAMPNPTLDVLEASSERGSSSVKAAEEAGAEAVRLANEQREHDVLGGWEVFNNLFDPDADLSVVILTTPYGKYHEQAVFFHKSEFAGFVSDDEELISNPKVTSEGVVLEIEDSDAWAASGEPLSEAGAFSVPILFYWDGEKVAHKGDVPPSSGIH